VLLLLAGVASAQEAKQESPADTWYAQVVTQSEMGFNVQHHWSKGRKLHAEVVAGPGELVITLVNGPWYYSIDAVRGQGIAVRRSPKALANDAAGGRPFGNEGQDLLERGAEKVRSEDVGGRKCDLYRLSEAAGRRELCLTSDEHRLPLRMETFSRASGFTFQKSFVNWTRELALPDAFFEPDPRWQLERFEYEDYAQRAARGPFGVPVLHGDLLHGR
jgi:hypothetical protein